MAGRQSWFWSRIIAVRTLSAARAEGRNKDDRTCVPLLAVLGAATRRTSRLLVHLVIQPPGWICLIVPACINASQGISHGIVLSQHMARIDHAPEPRESLQCSLVSAFHDREIAIVFVTHNLVRVGAQHRPLDSGRQG